MISDEEIIQKFRKGESWAIQTYFYDYLWKGYRAFDRRYQLSQKENLDFMSLAHQYAIYLIEHDWKPLETRSSEVSLRTWLIGGFRFVVLDALKWYKKEYGSLTFEDYLRSFNMSDDLRFPFNRMVKDVCDNMLTDQRDRMIVELILLKGYKGKEAAEKIGVSPSSVSQRYKRIMDTVIAPYFRKNFDLDLDEREMLSEWDSDIRHSTITEKRSTIRHSSITEGIILMSQKRTTPEYITELQPGEIFVFGSNLKGMHGGGAALVAYRKFGAIWGRGVGLQGQSYAIPTMQGGVETIRPYIDEFIQFATEHPELTFLVTRIGCGIAGFRDDDISPLFDKAHTLENVVLPRGW